MFRTKLVHKIKTQILRSITFFPPENSAEYETIRNKYCNIRKATDDNITRRVRIACWIPKATDTHSEHVIDCVWNVMAHEQKLDFVFRRKGRVHLNRRGRQFSRLLAGELCTSACRVCTARASLFCSHVTLTGYPLHSLVSPSLLHPCATVCHHSSTGLYLLLVTATMVTRTRLNVTFIRTLSVL
jgi:hypothetical protein